MQTSSLRDEDTAASYGDDPTRIYDPKMRKTLLLQLMEGILKPGELNLVQSYLGIGQSDGEKMTFHELTNRLNYNGSSGAEKAYKTALKKLRDNLSTNKYTWWCTVQRFINRALVGSDLETTA